MALQKLHEVTVFRHHNGIRRAGRRKDCGVLCIPKPYITNGERLQIEPHPEPYGRSRRKLCIQPEDHATTTG